MNIKEKRAENAMYYFRYWMIVENYYNNLMMNTKQIERQNYFRNKMDSAWEKEVLIQDWFLYKASK